MERPGRRFADVMTAIAVLAATGQAVIMWLGRNSHIELNLHHEQVMACAGVMSKAGPFMANVNALADFSVAVDGEDDKPHVLEARAYVKRLQSELNEHLSVLELLGDDELAKLASSLALDIQNLMNNATGSKNLGEEKYRDLRTYLTSSIEAFRSECRERLGAARGPKADDLH